MDLASLKKQLESMRVGARVRTPGGIFYANSGREVPEDARGTIRGVSHAGALVAVLWDGDAEAVWTPFTSVEALPS